MGKRLGWVVVWAIVAMLVVAAVQTARAERLQVTIGEPSDFPVQVFACDTRAQMTEILATYQRDGYEAAGKVVQRYRELRNDIGEPSCGNAGAFYIIVLEVYERFQVAPPGKGLIEVTVARIQLLGMEPPMVTWAGLSGIAFREKKRDVGV